MKGMESKSTSNRHGSGPQSENPRRSEPEKATAAPDAVRATGFESRVVYRGRQDYAAWIAFFPGEQGQWYLTCEEMWKADRKLPRMTREQLYEWSIPRKYDESEYERELLMLESRDGLQSWDVVSRQACRLRHSAGTFAQARTSDGRFLRFGWATQWMEPHRPSGRIFSVSVDDGRTWQEQPDFHSSRFASWAHRLRTLRDGTLVLAIPFSVPYGAGTESPIRACTNLDAESAMWMSLCFSYDQGRSWTTPLPIYGGHTVSETDFVELPSGDLLCINNSIFTNPGRQIVYRSEQSWMVGPYERVRYGTVPETACITEEGVLVGCMRAGRYFWSDDLGLTWQVLDSIPDVGPEVYQPWIHCLADGKIACAGHNGADNYFGECEQHVNLHVFRIDVARQTRDTRIEVRRDFDEDQSRWLNTYSLRLTCDGSPLADKELEFWYAERGKPGYESLNKTPLEKRTESGGQTIRVRTGPRGGAQVSLPRLDQIDDIHHSIQLVVRFNADRRDAEYKPTQSPQFEFYSNQSY